MTPTLTLTQKFYLLQLRKNRKSFYRMPTTSEGYLLGIQIMELRLRELVDITEDSKIRIIDSSPTGLNYLDETLKFISDNKNKTIIDLYYTFLSSGKYHGIPNKILESLISESGENLEIDEELVRQPIESLRAELLEPGEVSNENKALILMLDTSNYDKKLSKYYFSVYEQEILQGKIQEIRANQTDIVTDLIRISHYYQGTLWRFFSEIFVALNPKNWSNESILGYEPRNINLFLDIGLTGLLGFFAVDFLLSKNYLGFTFNFFIIVLEILETKPFYNITKLDFNSDFTKFIRLSLHITLSLLLIYGAYAYFSGLNFNS